MEFWINFCLRFLPYIDIYECKQVMSNRRSVVYTHCFGGV